MLIGVLLGFILSSLAGSLVEDSGIVGNGESPEARTYMLGLLENDPDSLAALTPGRGIVARAMQLQNANEAAGTNTPISLTYLGGRSLSGVTVNIYAIEVRNSRGRNQFFPLALTLVGGKVVRRE
jgi:hypothetical protein